PSAPPSVMPGTLRSASASEEAPCVCSSALLITVTDCGMSRRSPGSLLSEGALMKESRSRVCSILTSGRMAVAVTAGAACAVTTGVAASVACAQAAGAENRASRAEAMGVRRFIGRFFLVVSVRDGRDSKYESLAFANDAGNSPPAPMAPVGGRARAQHRPPDARRAREVFHAGQLRRLRGRQEARRHPCRGHLGLPDEAEVLRVGGAARREQ